MDSIIIGCLEFILALLALAWALRTEWTQSRDSGPIAKVATLPYAAAAGLLSGGGAFFLTGGRTLISLLWAGATCLCVAVLGIVALNLVSKKPE